MIVTLILVYFLSMLPFAAGARYRVPVIPFLLILGASALRRIVALLAARKWLVSLFAAAAAGGLYLLCSINYTGFQPAPEKWHYDRGLARLAAGDWNEAVREFDRALVYQPGYGSAYTNRGIALQKAGLLEEAARSYRWAIQLDPASLPPRKNLADLLLEEGKTEEAFALYREAIAAGPEYTGVAVDLARGLAREGRGRRRPPFIGISSGADWIPPTLVWVWVTYFWKRAIRLPPKKSTGRRWRLTLTRPWPATTWPTR